MVPGNNAEFYQYEDEGRNIAEQAQHNGSCLSFRNCEELLRIQDVETNHDLHG